MLGQLRDVGLARAGRVLGHRHAVLGDRAYPGAIRDRGDRLRAPGRLMSCPTEKRMPPSRQKSTTACTQAAESPRTRISPSTAGGRQLLEPRFDRRHLVGAGVGAGVAGPQDAVERGVGALQVAEHRVEAEAALVVAGRALLLGVGAEQRGVDVEDRPLGGGAEREGALPRQLARRFDPLQLRRADPLDRPEGGGVGGDLAEEAGLVAERGQIAEVLAALGQGDDQVAQDLPVVMGGAPLAGRRQRLPQRLGQPQPVT